MKKVVILACFVVLIAAQPVEESQEDLNEDAPVFGALSDIFKAISSISDWDSSSESADGEESKLKVEKPYFTLSFSSGTKKETIDGSDASVKKTESKEAPGLASLLGGIDMDMIRSMLREEVSAMVKEEVAKAVAPLMAKQAEQAKQTEAKPSLVPVYVHRRPAAPYMPMPAFSPYFQPGPFYARQPFYPMPVPAVPAPIAPAPAYGEHQSDEDAYSALEMLRNQLIRNGDFELSSSLSADSESLLLRQGPFNFMAAVQAVAASLQSFITSVNVAISSVASAISASAVSQFSVASSVVAGAATAVSNNIDSQSTFASSVAASIGDIVSSEVDNRVSAISAALSSQADSAATAFSSASVAVSSQLEPVVGPVTSALSSASAAVASVVDEISFSASSAQAELILAVSSVAAEVSASAAAANAEFASAVSSVAAEISASAVAANAEFSASVSSISALISAAVSSVIAG